MMVPKDKSEIECIVGSKLSEHELHFEYSIPRQEIASFHNFIYIYPNGGIIIEEGERDQSLYLLRSGSVGIYKQVGSVQEQIDTINAVNFFGEMSLINEEPRSATVLALEKNVIVYKLTQPNIHMILQNPKWAELLISRLSKNLAKSNENLVSATALVGELRSSVEYKEKEFARQQKIIDSYKENMRLMLGAILYFQNIVKELAIVGSKGWAYLNALMKMTHALIGYYTPDISATSQSADRTVIRQCLASIRRDDQETIFNELDQKL